ncbi:glycosyltransferase [Bacillus sp. FJAT-45350]|uniref:glycosyltransferase n=1 Tax=Bacillus sp. FJAT-45350 TaxID=2011014 RepID=UPI000BB71EE5|nr:glycosyltransferase [Bacillus sp. FJAT-45350]
MGKIQTIGTISEFMSGSWKESPKTISLEAKILSSSVVGSILLVPKLALASVVDGTFGNVHGAIMNMFDAGVVLVIIFSGAAWGLGHRTKALEILIGVSCGYILARHAVDIRDFLKAI